MNRLNGRHSFFPCIKHLVSAHQTLDKGAQYPVYASLYIKRVKGQTGFFNAKNVSFLPTNAQHRRITYTKTCLKFLSKSFQTLSHPACKIFMQTTHHTQVSAQTSSTQSTTLLLKSPHPPPSSQTHFMAHISPTWHLSYHTGTFLYNIYILDNVYLRY